MAAWLLGLISAACENTSLQHLRPRILGYSCLVFNSTRRLVESSLFTRPKEITAPHREKTLDWHNHKSSQHFSTSTCTS